MSREWKPGDVAMGSGGRVLLRMEAHAAGCSHPGSNIGHWHNHHQHIADFSVVAKGARPLVVIDPEDREQVGRLLDLIENFHRTTPHAIVDLAQVLRDFAKPSKPEEPTAHYAVVEDADGFSWILCAWNEDEQQWNRCGTSTFQDYADIDVVAVLSEGVTE